MNELDRQTVEVSLVAVGSNEGADFGAGIKRGSNDVSADEAVGSGTRASLPRGPADGLFAESGWSVREREVDLRSWPLKLLLADWRETERDHFGNSLDPEAPRDVERGRLPRHWNTSWDVVIEGSITISHGNKRISACRRPQPTRILQLHDSAPLSAAAFFSVE